jgi:hypothetical protein
VWRGLDGLQGAGLRLYRRAVAAHQRSGVEARTISEIRHLSFLPTHIVVRLSYGGCAWGTFGCAGPLRPVFHTCAQLPPIHVEVMDGIFIKLSEISNNPVLHIDSQAPLGFLFASADRRIRMARHLLEWLEGADDCDVRYMANAALMLLSDGCDALDAVEKQVFNLSGPVKQ